jgi:hypothetical protein
MDSRDACVPVSLYAKFLVLCLLVYSPSANFGTFHYHKYFVINESFRVIIATNMLDDCTMLEGGE